MNKQNRLLDDAHLVALRNVVEGSVFDASNGIGFERAKTIVEVATGISPEFFRHFTERLRKHTDKSPMQFDALIKEINTSGYSWVVEGQPSGEFAAYVQMGREPYIGDYLCSGIGCSVGHTPFEALTAAYNYAKTQKWS